MAGKFRNKIIFGLGVQNQLNELRANADESLRNLNLEPNDFQVLEDIGSESDGIPKHFQRLSQLDENAVLKLDSLKGETNQYNTILQKFYQNDYIQSGLYPFNFPQKIDGNLHVHGRIIAKRINQRTFDNDSKEFRTTQITPAVNSVWIKDGNEISFGGGLKIINNDIDPTKAKVVAGTLKNVKPFTPRRFDSENATHKIQVTINGTDYFMYAIKNNPFKFKGTFENVDSGNLKITGTSGNTNDEDINYVLTSGEGEDIQEYQSDNSNDNIDNLKEESGDNLFVYVDPVNVLKIELINHDITKLPPTAEFTNCTDIDLSGSALTEFPNFTNRAPALARFTYDNSLNISVGSNIFIDNFPATIQKIQIDNSLKDLSFDDSPLVDLSSLSSLTTLNLSNNEITGSTPILPNTIQVLNLSFNNFDSLESATLQPSLTSIDFQENNNLKLSEDSPHSYFDSATFAGLSGAFNIQDTKLPIPPVQNRALISFTAEGLTYDGLTGDRYTDDRYEIGSKFNGCTSLTSINFNNSETVHGPIPNFSTNTALETVLLLNVGIIGPNDGEAIGQYHFPPSLRTFTYSLTERTIDSPYSTTLNVDAFKYEDDDVESGKSFVPFTDFTYKSRGYTTGAFPQISVSNRLDIRENAFSLLPAFPNSQIKTLIANDNEFSQDLDLDTTFANVVSNIEEINLKDNLFTAFESIDTQFAKLKILNFENAFTDVTNEYDSPADGISVPSFSNLPKIETINVSKNPIYSIENNLFSGCNNLSNFSIDVGNDLNFVNVITQSIRNLVTSNNSRIRTIFFSTTGTTLDLTIDNFNTLRAENITEEIRENFNLNELIEEVKTLSNGKVTFNGIEKDDKYADIPEAPNVTLEFEEPSPAPVPDSPPDSPLPPDPVYPAILSWPIIANADRVIIERKIGDGNFEEIAELVKTATTYTEEDSPLPNVTAYRVYGENFRSVMEDTQNKTLIQIN